MKKLSLFVVLILVTAIFATVSFAVDYLGYTKRGTFYEYPAYTGGPPATVYSPYYPSTYYPERYYYYPRTYDYTRDLYRYSAQYPKRVIEAPSYMGFLTKVFSNAGEGQLCGIFQNKYYMCASELTCNILERGIGLCIRESKV